ncbi:hypothetical protein DINM_005285 [Dirofilaria immitis]|nr:hypothetical protein [Dirofilaria immitis]
MVDVAACNAGGGGAGAELRLVVSFLPVLRQQRPASPSPNFLLFLARKPWKPLCSSNPSSEGDAPYPRYVTEIGGVENPLEGVSTSFSLATEMPYFSQSLLWAWRLR